MSILLIDGNNLGHALGYIDRAAGRYDGAGLLACLEGVVRHLASQRQELKTVLFLDDVSAAERLGGWRVQVAPIPEGDADAAIRAYAQAHAGHPQILVSGDQALCGDAALWGVVCLSPRAFISRYVTPARDAGFSSAAGRMVIDGGSPSSDEEMRQETRPTAPQSPPKRLQDRGKDDRRRQVVALEQAGAALRGEFLPPPEVYRLNPSRWVDAAELALYLAQEHMCPDHPDLTDPEDMIAAIREHCGRQPRYFTSGRVINRVFRLFLCRPEHSLSLDDLVRLAQTRRRKIRAAIQKYGVRLGIEVVW